FRRVERLIFTEKFAGKLRSNKLRAAAGCPVHDQNRVRDLAARVLVDFAERAVMDFQFGQRFAGSEFEIVDGVIAFGWRRIVVGTNKIVSCVGSEHASKCRETSGHGSRLAPSGAGFQRLEKPSARDE